MPDKASRRRLPGTLMAYIRPPGRMRNAATYHIWVGERPTFAPPHVSGGTGGNGGVFGRVASSRISLPQYLQGWNARTTIAYVTLLRGELR